MDITLRQLKSFLAIARYASFTQAAQALNLSQPALTAQMKQLEAGLKVKLFDRSTHYVRITHAGTTFIPIAQRAVGDLESAVAASRRAAGPRQELVRLACLPAFAGSVLPVALSTLRRSNPALSIALKDVGSRRGVAMVRSEDVECAVTLDHPKATDLECTRLLDDEMLIVYPAGHAIGKAKKATLSAVSEFNVILLGSEDCESRAMVDAAVAGLVVPAIEVAYISSAIAMVKAGLGIAILPSIALNFSRTRGELRSRRIDDANLTRHIAVTTKRGLTLPQQVQNFIEVLIAESKRYKIPGADKR